MTTTQIIDDAIDQSRNMTINAILEIIATYRTHAISTDLDVYDVAVRDTIDTLKLQIEKFQHNMNKARER